jgi:hypothetical protein
MAIVDEELRGRKVNLQRQIDTRAPFDLGTLQKPLRGSSQERSVFRALHGITSFHLHFRVFPSSLAVLDCVFVRWAAEIKTLNSLLLALKGSTLNIQASELSSYSPPHRGRGSSRLARVVRSNSARRKPTSNFQIDAAFPSIHGTLISH